MKSKDSFTVTEVGTLIESFRSDVSIIAEEVRGLSARVERVENCLGRVEDRLTSVEDAVKVAALDLYKRVSRLETKVGI